jgi:uncharacterized membrane protein YeaQ/YmgE (transglycosylase-associated protein family)
MGFIMWMIVGLICGWLTSEVTRGRGRSPVFLNNILFGIIGALGGGILATELLGVPDPLSAINVTTTIVSFAGAITIILIACVLREDRTPI